MQEELIAHAVLTEFRKYFVVNVEPVKDSTMLQVTITARPPGLDVELQPMYHQLYTSFVISKEELTDTKFYSVEHTMKRLIRMLFTRVK